MNAAGRRLERLVNGRRVAVVGVGNRLRGDDGLGAWIAANLAARGSRTAFDAGPVPEDYIGPVLATGASVVLFVDAVTHGGRPGDCCVATLDALAPRLDSTHAASLALCGQVLEAHGLECWLVGIEPASTAFSVPMSCACVVGARAIEAVLAELLDATEATHA